jgi:dTDP-4-dehydrorhamnose reductase
LALERQLQWRGQAFACIAPAQLASGRKDPLAESGADGSGVVVVDTASQELISSGRLRGFSAAAFQRLVDNCRQRQLPLLMISDSRVFAGAAKQRYRESDATAPVVPAGVQLLQREQYLAQQLEHHVILRTGPLIATTGDNLLTQLVQSFRRGGPLAVATEPRFCPTPVADLARVISGIIDQLNCAAPCWGVYHYHSSDAASVYEFAEATLASAAQYWDMGGGKVQLQGVVMEPPGGVYPLLNCQRIRDTFGIQQLPWRRAIPQLLKDIYERESA